MTEGWKAAIALLALSGVVGYVVRSLRRGDY